jgi:hypothetical protein
MPCLYASTIIAHSRFPLALAAFKTESTSAGSRWIIEELIGLRAICIVSIEASFENATLC